MALLECIKIKSEPRGGFLPVTPRVDQSSPLLEADHIGGEGLSDPFLFPAIFIPRVKASKQYQQKEA